VLTAARKHIGGSVQHNPPEKPPVFSVAIHNHADLWVLGYIPQAPKLRWRLPFWLLVNSDVESAARGNETDWHDVRDRPFIRGGEMSDPSVRQEAANGIRQDAEVRR
jgi:hypothetical protein